MSVAEMYFAQILSNHILVLFRRWQPVSHQTITTNTLSMLFDKTQVWVHIKGMTRSARPGMHFIRGLSYVTTVRLADMMLVSSVVKTAAPKVKVLLHSEKSSNDDNQSTSSFSGDSGIGLT